MKPLALLLLFFICSCQTPGLTPEDALKDFVETRIGKVIDREFIMDRVTGKMLESFKNMPEQEFEKFSNMKDIKTDSFKIISKSCQQEDRCFLTYSIGYTTKNGDQNQFVTEVKKIAEMVQVEKKWLIAEVSNIKTYHESLEAINPLQ